MTVDEYRDLWIEVLERHEDDDGDLWPAAFLAEWRDECGSRGLSSYDALVLCETFFDDVVEFELQHGLGSN